MQNCVGPAFVSCKKCDFACGVVARWRLTTLLGIGCKGRLLWQRFLLLRLLLRLLGGELLFVGFEIFAQTLFAFPLLFCLASLKGFALIFKKIVGHELAMCEKCVSGCLLLWLVEGVAKEGAVED